MRALVTGASSGIGRALARAHAARGGELVLVARRRERLEELEAELRGTQVLSLAVDLSRPDGPERVFRACSEAGLAVDVLMNSAGLGDRGRFAEAPLERHLAIVEVNIAALTAMTRLFVPPMVARGRGRVLNVASMAAFVPGPTSAVYHASKAYVLSLSEALADELAGTGVTVTAACPGATATEFAEVAGLARTRAFARPASAEAVAEHAYRAMLRGARIAVPGIGHWISALMTRLMPRRLVTVAARLALKEAR